MNARQRYEKQLEQDIVMSQMQEPILTKSGLYIWENWTYNNEGNITDIRYFAEDKDGGKIFRISFENFLQMKQ